LVVAKDDEDARSLLIKHPKFDIIPIERNNELTSYQARDSEHAKDIHLTDVISAETSVLDLVDLFLQRKFYFVLLGKKLCGYVHFSDLNNRVVKLPLFAIIESLEYQLMGLLSPIIDECLIEQVLSEQRARMIKGLMRKNTKNRTDLGWVNLLSFADTVKLASHLKRISLRPEEVELISSVRNRIVHADKPLVGKYDDIEQLAKAGKICLSAISTIASAGDPLTAWLLDADSHPSIEIRL
jgi:hypothetical protein